MFTYHHQLVLVNRAYYKIRGWVKRIAPAATSLGWGGAYGVVEDNMRKAPYQASHGLRSNDLIGPQLTAKGRWQGHWGLRISFQDPYDLPKLDLLAGIFN
jgi:hypothetical protein